MKHAIIRCALLGMLLTPIVAQEPSQFVSLGVGVQGLIPSQVFGYFSVAQRIAEGTFTTQTSEFVRMPGGTVGTSVRAGISRTLWQIGPCTLGVVGEAGAAEGSSGSASGAFSGRGFIAVRVRKSPFHFLATGQTLKIAGVGEQATVTLGIGLGVY